MAFCNSCGAPLTAGTSFCNKCGTAVSGAPGAAPASFPPPPPSTGGGSALKIVLIVIAVIVGIGILGLGSLAIIGYHLAKSAHVTQEGDHVKVETPFGSVETSKDPAQVVKDLGVDVYPGAQAQKNGTATVSFGNMHTVAASFESSDSVDQVCTFYKSRFPKATVTSSDQNRCSIVAGDPKNMININVQNHGGTTKFQISNVSKTSGSSNSGSSN
jgi:zinc ribbon protein